MRNSQSEVLSNMMKRTCLSLFLLCIIPLLLEAQHTAPLKLIQTIPLPGLKEGDFDHFAIDLDGHRLFLTGEANGLVGHIGLNIDADSQAYDPDTKLMYVVSGGREAHTPYSYISVVDTTQS